MGYEFLHRLAMPILPLALAACTAPAPFPLLGQAEQCVETARDEGYRQGSVDTLLREAAAYAGAARRSSNRPEAEHYAYLALQQCRTAGTMAEGRYREEDMTNLEITRLSLLAGLRALQMQTADRQAEELSSRLGISQADGEIRLDIPVEKTMFGRGGRGLRPEAAPLISELTGFLRQHGQWQVSIESSPGPEARRGAASVRHSLVARGLPPERILLRHGREKGFVHLLIARPH